MGQGTEHTHEQGRRRGGSVGKGSSGPLALGGPEVQGAGPRQGSTALAHSLHVSSTLDSPWTPGGPCAVSAAR